MTTRAFNAARRSRGRQPGAHRIPSAGRFGRWTWHPGPQPTTVHPIRRLRRNKECSLGKDQPPIWNLRAERREENTGLSSALQHCGRQGLPGSGGPIAIRPPRHWGRQGLPGSGGFTDGNSASSATAMPETPTSANRRPIERTRSMFTSAREALRLLLWNVVMACHRPWISITHSLWARRFSRESRWRTLMLEEPRDGQDFRRAGFSRLRDC